MARLRYIENARTGDAGSVVLNDSKLFFDDTGAYINCSTSNQLELVATTVKITGALVTGNVVSAARFYEKITVTSLTTAETATYTAAQIVGGFIIDAITNSMTGTTGTATAINAAIPNCQDGSSFEFTIKNAAASGITITLGAGADVTITGTATIAQNNSKRFLYLVTSVASHTATIYSLGTVVH